MTRPENLEIRVHGVDDRIAAFVSNGSEAVGKLLEQFDPARLFAQPFLTIAGRDSLTLFPCRTVVRVDLVMDGFPGWTFHHRIADVRELGEEEFRRFAPVRSADLESDLHRVFAEVELTNGERVFLELHVRPEPRMAVDFGMLLQSYLSAPSHYARRRGGGAVVINPAHILRLQFHPRPPVVPPGAWCGEPLTRREGIGSSRQSRERGFVF